AVLDTVTSLAFAIDAKDHYTQGHSQKVAAYAALIAEALGMDDAEVEEIRLGAVLHDIGKVGIPENILNKNGPLNPEEWETMKSHVGFGAKILEPLTPLARIREMVLHHHEFFDASGYPTGVSGEAISLGARIIAVADAYDTITSDRTYKKARPAAEALVELERCANAHFDAKGVAAFVRTMNSRPWRSLPSSQASWQFRCARNREHREGRTSICSPPAVALSRFAGSRDRTRRRAANPARRIR